MERWENEVRLLSALQRVLQHNTFKETTMIELTDTVQIEFRDTGTQDVRLLRKDCTKQLAWLTSMPSMKASTTNTGDGVAFSDSDGMFYHTGDPNTVMKRYPGPIQECNKTEYFAIPEWNWRKPGDMQELIFQLSTIHPTLDLEALAVYSHFSKYVCREFNIYSRMNIWNTDYVLDYDTVIAKLLEI